MNDVEMVRRLLELRKKMVEDRSSVSENDLVEAIVLLIEREYGTELADR